MADRIVLKIDDARLKAKLGEIRARAEDMTPAFNAIGNVLHSSIEENFANEGRYGEVGSSIGGNNKWQPLSPATLYAKIGGAKGYTKGGVAQGRLRKAAQRKLSKNKILQESGQLAASIHEEADRNGVELGTNKPYAAIHNFGGMAGRNRKVEIPARPYMVAQEEDIVTSCEILEGFLTDGLE
jgi:phage gpG-like protein